jgi:hypothetical protein
MGTASGNGCKLPATRFREGAKTFVIDPPMVFAGGVAIGMASARVDGSVFAAAAGAIFGVAFGLSVGWFALSQPDWMAAYLADAERLGVFRLYGAFLAVLVLCGAAGGVVGNAATRQVGYQGALLACLAGVALWMFLWVLQLDAYLHVGTTAEYRAGRAVPLAAHAEMRERMNVAGPLGAFAFGAPLALALWRRRRRKE